MKRNWKIIVIDKKRGTVRDLMRNMTYTEALDFCNEFGWSWYRPYDMDIDEQEIEDRGGAYCE